MALVIGGLFWFGVVSFGLWIWDDPLQRAAALGVGVAMVALVVVSWRRGAFTARTIVEYRVESGPPDRGVLSVVSGGRRVAVGLDIDETTGRRHLDGEELVITTPNRVRSMSVDLPCDVAQELALWVHAIGPDGTSVTTPVDIRVHDGPAERAFRSGGHASSTMLAGGGDRPARVTISLTGEAVPP